MTQTTATADSLRTFAEMSHAQYPQYRGHWNGWVLGTMRRTLRRHGRGFILATKGEHVLVDPASISDGFVTVFSASYEAGNGRGMDVSVKCSDVEVIG